MTTDAPIRVIAKPTDDEEFQFMVGRIADVLSAACADDWDEAFTILEDIGFDVDRAREYAEQQAEKAEKATPPEAKPTTGWRCVDCEKGTLSRCLSCDEATCGDCLATHRCEEVG